MNFLNKTLLSTSLIVGALSLSPLAATGTVHATGGPPAGASALRHDDPFPQPSEGLHIKLAECESLAALLDTFAEVTGETLLYNGETEVLLRRSTTGLHKDLSIAPGQVYSSVQDILIANRVVLTDLRRAAPRMLMVESLESANRASIKSNALYVPAVELGRYSDFSAMLIRTSIYLPNMDMRSLGNSIRQLVVDPNTMQMIPVPESSQVIITGFGNSIVRIVAMLKDMDAAAEMANTRSLKAAANSCKQGAEIAPEIAAKE